MHEISAIVLSSTILTLTFVIPMQSLHKISFNFKKEGEDATESQENGDSESKVEEPETKEVKGAIEEEELIDVPQIRSRQHLVAHREVLEEIPEVEVEYESRREKMEGLEEILEEEEDEEPMEDEMQGNDDDDLEIIEEEQGGEDEMWEEREEPPRRPYSRNHNEDQDLDEWEWTANGSSRNGAQYYRYTR